MHTARFQIIDSEASSLYAHASANAANDRNRRFPAGWWIVPSVLPGLALLIWAITRLF